MKCTVLECQNEVIRSDRKILPDSNERICLDCLQTRKMCRVCGQILLHSEFDSEPEHKDGLQNWCKHCHSIKFDFQTPYPIAFIRRGCPDMLKTGELITHDNEFAKTEAEMRDYCKTCHCAFCNLERDMQQRQKDEERRLNESGTL